VYVHEKGQGTVEDNDIFDNGFSGIRSHTSGNPVVRNNRVNKNARFGIGVDKNGGGTFEDNDLTENTKGAWYIAADSKTNIKRINNKV
jgi:F-box protein 11